ncbi:MAG: phosphate ABC transporter permease PstA [Clostridiaceae bacterium]|nr:phosphate ABC transporter permease PstA [Clostridiaceae bacterium]
MNKRLESILLRAAVYTAIGLTAGVLLWIVGYILYKGVSHLTPSLFAWKYTSDNGSVTPAIVNTITMTMLALTFALPIGVGAAIYLSEYARRGNKVASVLRTAAQTLAGIPSIIYGLFGYLAFVIALGWSYSMLAGAMTLALMILPVVLRTTEEALLSVPQSVRDASFALGAGKLRTVFRVALPSASPGILSGVVLATGRVVGETAALIYTAGTVAQIPATVMGSGRTLAIHMYALWKEGLAQDKAYATAVVLLVVSLGLNLLSDVVAKKLEKGREMHG